jgi:homoserine kinase
MESKLRASVKFRAAPDSIASAIVGGYSVEETRNKLSCVRVSHLNMFKIISS